MANPNICQDQSEIPRNKTQTVAFSGVYAHGLVKLSLGAEVLRFSKIRAFAVTRTHLASYAMGMG
jgi:hypothetical protein